MTLNEIEESFPWLGSSAEYNILTVLRVNEKYRKIHSNRANGKNTPYCRRLGPFALALLVLRVCKELINYQYVMFGLSVWQAPSRGQGSKHWMENTSRVLLVASTHSANLDQKKTGHMMEWEKEQ